MLRRLLDVLDLLLAVEHLPALDAQHFSVRFLLDIFQFLNEFLPFGRVFPDHAVVDRKLDAYVI